MLRTDGGMPLAGRAHELEVIRRSMSSARRDRACQAIVLDGEPGIGKSALLRAVCALGNEDGWLAATTTCHAVQAHHPLAVVRHLVRDMLVVLGSKAETYTTGLDSLLQADASPESAAKALFRLLEGATLDIPVLIALDDAQWADRDSMICIADSVEALADRPLVVLLARRRTQGGELDLALRADSVIPLEPLSTSDAAEIVRSAAPTAPEELVTAIVRQGRGYPIDLVSLSRAANDEQLTSVEQIATTRRALIAADVRSMQPQVREFLQTCSLIGSSVEYRVLEQLWPDGNELEQLTHQSSGRYVRFDDSGLSFHHALIAEGIRETIAVPIPYRRRIIAALERLADRSPEECEMLASQHATTGKKHAAFLVLTSLAQDASQRGQPRLVVSALERALEYSFPDAENVNSFFRLYANALMYLGRTSQAAAVLARALQVVDANNLPLTSTMVLGLVQSQLASGQGAIAHETYERYSRRLEDAADKTYARMAEVWLSAHLADLDGIVRVRTELERTSAELPFMMRVHLLAYEAFVRSIHGQYETALDLIRDAQSLQLPSYDLTPSQVRSHLEMMRLLILQTRLGASVADRAFEERDRGVEYIFGYFKVLKHFFDERWDLAGVSIERTLGANDNLEDQQYVLPFAAAISALTSPTSWTGRIAQGVEAFLGGQQSLHLASLAAWWVATPGPESERGLRAATLKRLLQCQGDLSAFGLAMPLRPALVLAAFRLSDTEALASLASAESGAATPWHSVHDRFASSLARTLVGDAAATDTGLASDLASLGLNLYADLLLANQSKDRAAIERLRALGVAPLLQRRAPVEDESAQARPTPRELQIAQQVAAGKSNSQVATELVLSQRTVEAHLSNLFGKLGLSSRTQLAAWYLREHAVS